MLQGSFQSTNSLLTTNPFVFTRTFLSSVIPTDESYLEKSNTNIDRYKTYKGKKIIFKKYVI